ncbi:thiamine phosphate synthase [Parasaccharibacter sp. TMW 2.1886]|nr:thiamine phosphate synthase [Parasaccharibacter sp. TMW 2.1886]
MTSCWTCLSSRRRNAGQPANNLSHLTLMNHCDLYPVIPSLPALTQLQAQLPPLLAQEAVTALRLCFDRPPERKQLDAVRQMAWERDVALILAPANLDLLHGLSLKESDGVHLSSPKDVKTFAGRRDRPEAFQIGCHCLTLDDAMLAGEQGADYVSLPAIGLTALKQWSLFAELPVVAEHVCTTEEALAATQAGADFLAITLDPAENGLDHFTAISAAIP